jgi:hypothetical protein
MIAATLILRKFLFCYHCMSFSEFLMNILFHRFTVDEAFNITENEINDDDNKHYQIVFLLPIETANPDTDKDSEESDNKCNENVNHLPSRILKETAKVIYPRSCKPSIEMLKERKKIKPKNNALAISSIKIQKRISSRKRKLACESNLLDVELQQTKSEALCAWNEEEINENLQPAMLFHAARQTINTAADCFKWFCNTDLIRMLTEQSNLFAQQKGKQGDILEEEMYVFMAILLLSGYAPLPY